MPIIPDRDVHALRPDHHRFPSFGYRDDIQEILFHCDVRIMRIRGFAYARRVQLADGDDAVRRFFDHLHCRRVVHELQIQKMIIKFINSMIKNLYYAY